MSHRQRLLLFALFALLLVGAAIGGGWYWFVLGPRSDATDTVIIHGNVDIREAELTFEVEGRLAAIEVEEGDRVAHGDLLATLEPTRYRQAVAEAQARMLAQRQRALELARGSRPEEIRKARAEMEAAQAELENARSRLERLQGLVDREFISPQRIDNAQTAQRAARARLRASRESLELAKKGPRKEQIAAGRAKLEALEAALARRREDLADTKLYAPADGIIRNRLAEIGEMASPQAPVLTLALRDEVWVRAFLPEPQLGRVAPGMAATIRSDSLPRRTLPAQVGHISPTAEFTPKTVQTTEVRPNLVYRVRILACEPFPGLRLGMPVTVTIRTGGERDDAPCP